jgi:hypothetical protein
METITQITNRMCDRIELIERIQSSIADVEAGGSGRLTMEIPVLTSDFTCPRDGEYYTATRTWTPTEDNDSRKYMRYIDGCSDDLRETIGLYANRDYRRVQNSMLALFSQVFGKNIPDIEQGLHPDFQQATPKACLLAALKSLIAQGF